MLAQDIEHFREKTCSPKLHLNGMSYGTAVAAVYADMRPSLRTRGRRWEKGTSTVFEDVLLRFSMTHVMVCSLLGLFRRHDHFSAVELFWDMVARKQ